VQVTGCPSSLTLTCTTATLTLSSDNKTLNVVTNVLQGQQAGWARWRPRRPLERWLRQPSSSRRAP